MGFNIKAILGNVAPVLTMALPPPFSGLANAALASALGKPGASPDDVMKVLQQNQLTPEQLLAVKQADLEFQETMAKLGFDNQDKLEELATQDRENARQRETNVKDLTPRILAYVYTAGFLAVLGAEIWIGVKGYHIDPLVAKSIDILLGVLTGMVLGTKEYYFGTSSGDDHKTDLLAQAPPIQK